MTTTVGTEGRPSRKGLLYGMARRRSVSEMGEDGQGAFATVEEMTAAGIFTTEGECGRQEHFQLCDSGTEDTAPNTGYT